MKIKQKILSFFFFSALFLSSCSNSDDLAIPDGLDDPVMLNENNSAQFERLSFSNEEDLLAAILGENARLRLSLTQNNSFISLMDEMPGANLRSDSDHGVTYYEALGFDSLIPNPNFARLVNPLGELIVADDIIKITPNGTYRIIQKKLQLFNTLYEQDSTLTGTLIDEKTFQIQEGIYLYRTFEKDGRYALEYDGEYDFLIEDGYDNDLRASTSAPSLETFTTFSADRHTFVGKLIQNIIGGTKTHTINFSSSRRIKGSFYFYNYGVYAEIGVSGWTDKKNWIGWSKTESDELHVGWTRVVLKQTIPDYYAQSMKTIDELTYFPPQYMNVNGQRINVATLVMPDFQPTLKDKMLAQGSKAIFDYLKSTFKIPQSELEKAQSFLIAARTELYYVFDSDPVVKYREKSYTHVFAQTWTSFEIGYNSQSGLFINGINQKNYDQTATWFKVIGKAMNEKKPTLISGEVYTCARFGDNWRGMRIVKK